MDLLQLFYRPSAKDVASGSSTWLKRYFRTLTVGPTASASLSAQDTDFVAADTVRWLDQVVLFWQPGAAQNPRSTVIWSSDAGGTIQGVVAGYNVHNPITAAQPFRHTLQLSFPMFAGEVLNFAATFDAGGAANTFNAYITGWEFPRGSLQR